MIYIDYFGGAYGKFLEYVCNRYFFSVKGTSPTPFLKSGATHIPDKEYQDNRIVTAKNFSYFTKAGTNFKFNKDDIIIRITVDKDSLYHVYYNSLMRAGDQSLITLVDLEMDTLNKLDKSGSKFINLKNQIISDFGTKKNYSRSSIRNYFYSALREPELALDEINFFIDFSCYRYINFNVHNIDSLVLFMSALQKLSVELTGQRFKFDETLSELYYEFLKKNQGIHSLNKCKIVLEHILKGNNFNVELNIIEEAYINCIITEVFDIHSDINCFTDNYPTNTRVIYEQIIDRIK